MIHVCEKCNFHVCENETLRSCKNNILLIKKIILYNDSFL